mmetsp:Transcript_7069/g.25840  ORF Transcript_7069/g.25840 Transcript_7069/m.25840 type:complete len:293 (+) Transcript_7069:437-1315(+)
MLRLGARLFHLFVRSLWWTTALLRLKTGGFVRLAREIIERHGAVDAQSDATRGNLYKRRITRHAHINRRLRLLALRPITQTQTLRFIDNFLQRHALRTALLQHGERHRLGRLSRKSHFQILHGVVFRRFPSTTSVTNRFLRRLGHRVTARFRAAAALLRRRLQPRQLALGQIHLGDAIRPFRRVIPLHRMMLALLIVLLHHTLKFLLHRGPIERQIPPNRRARAVRPIGVGVNAICVDPSRTRARTTPSVIAHRPNTRTNYHTINRRRARSASTLASRAEPRRRARFTISHR